MSDWQAGDLALCIKKGAWEQWRGFDPGGGDPRPGGVYIVKEVEPADCPGGLLLGFAEFLSLYGAIRFKRIPPLTDEERGEFLADLNIREPQTC